MLTDILANIFVYSYNNLRKWETASDKLKLFINGNALSLVQRYCPHIWLYDESSSLWKTRQNQINLPTLFRLIKCSNMALF